MLVETLLARFKNVKTSGDGWLACCPAHDDRTPSLSISLNCEKILLHCHAGCFTEAIIQKLGLKMKDLFLDEPKRKREPIEYRYTDESNNHQFSVFRLDSQEEKKIWQRPAEGKVLKEVNYYPYKLENVLEFKDSETIFICEGEKCCEVAFDRLGIVATTNSGGAGQWTARHAAFLKGAKVVILPDCDKPGRLHAQQVAASLQGIAASIKVVELPGLADKEDIVQWIDKGGTKDQLKQLINDAPEYTGGELAEAEPREDTELPAIVWGSQYIKNGIPDRKPELIGGILRRSHKMLIGAPSKACKSFLAIRLALAIAQGRDWLTYPCTAGKVYVANFEIDEGSYVHRVKAVADALSWPMPENIAFHHLRGYGSEIETLLPAISQAIEGHDFSAVILDPQYKLLRSKEIRNFSENDAAAMSYLYGELDRHFSRQSISTVIISHFAKGMASGKESIDRIAGSGAPMRDVDAICTLTALDSDDSYRMEFSLREFKTPEPLSLHWTHPIHEIDPMLDGVALKSRPGRPGAARSADDSVVLQTVKGLNVTATQSAVRAVLRGDMGKDRVINALERLRVTGKLTTSTGEKNAIVYHAI